MWGNRLGWAISAVLVALCVGWLYFIATASTPTPATAFSEDAQNFAPIELPPPPLQALPPSSNVDAAALYRQAIQVCLANRPLYEDFARIGKLDSQAAGKLDAIEPLVQGGGGSEVRLFSPHPREIVNFDRQKPALDALQLLGRICIDRFGLLNQRAGKHEEAMKHYQAGMALGWNLANERLTYDEFSIGLELMARASAGMALLDQAELTPALREFDRQRVDYVRQRIEPLVRVTRAIDANIVGQHAGDLFELARRSSERMWRVEAIMALGRMRHFAGAGGTRANQANAMRLLRELAESYPDPVVRTAAEAARDLTVEQHRVQ